jgi:hypothetical protein
VALGGSFGGRVVMDPSQVARLMSDPNQPVMRDMIRQGTRVKREAQRLVGVYKPPPAGPRRARKPGTLRDSIVMRVVQDGDGAAVIVGSEDPVALIHHEGTIPHRIVAKNAPLLVFWSGRAGRVVKVRAVNHPGTKPNRYLVNALRAIET